MKYFFSWPMIFLTMWEILSAILGVTKMNYDQHKNHLNKLYSELWVRYITTYIRNSNPKIKNFDNLIWFNLIFRGRRSIRSSPTFKIELKLRRCNKQKFIRLVNLISKLWNVPWIVNIIIFIIVFKKVFLFF